MKYVIAFQTHYIEIVLGFMKAVNVRIGKSSIPAKTTGDGFILIPFNDGFQNTFSVIAAIDIAIVKQGSLHIAKLTEYEQGVITGIAEMSIASRTCFHPLGSPNQNSKIALNSIHKLYTTKS